MVSVTPLQIDLTQYAKLESVRDWLKEPALT
jgi:broad specificity polyphosphatase/5'/3'-nucleotidase SurE